MSPLPILRERNAKYLLGNRVLSQCGDGMLQTALATFVLFSPQRATSASQITAIFAALLIPYSVIGPFVGVLIDKWTRRSILIFANLIRLLAITLIALTVADHTSNLTLGVLVLICLGINRFLLATHASSVPHVVAPELLINANAIFPTLGTIGSSIGGAFGLGIQHVLGNVDSVNAGIIATSGLVALCAATCAYYIFPRDILGPHHNGIQVRHELKNVLHDIANAVTDIRHHPRVITGMLSVILQRVAFGAVTVHTLLLVRLSWHSSTNPNAALNDFGVVAVCAATGAGVAAAVSALLFRKYSKTAFSHQSRMKFLLRLNLASTGLTVITLAVGTFSEAKLGICIAAFSLGLCGQFLKISADTTIQNDIPDSQRGRTFAIFDMLINVALVIGVSIFALVATIRENHFVNAASVSLLMLIVLAFNSLGLRRLKNSADSTKL